MHYYITHNGMYHIRSAEKFFKVEKMPDLKIKDGYVFFKLYEIERIEV